VLVEPVMAVEVVVPEQFLGTVIGDLTARRGAVTGLGERNGARSVTARVPLAELVGYATDLRSSTPGPGVVHDDAFGALAGTATLGHRGRHPRTAGRGCRLPC
jgi:translation elongation factor EF-G